MRAALPELGQPGRGRVLVEAGLGAGPLGGLDDVVRSREIRLARAEPDDGPARGFERLGFAVHGQRGGFGDGGNASGDARVG